MGGDRWKGVVCRKTGQGIGGQGEGDSIDVTEMYLTSHPFHFYGYTVALPAGHCVCSKVEPALR